MFGTHPLLETGDKLTLISSELEINHGMRSVWIAYTLGGDRNEQVREIIVFFFYNGDEPEVIKSDLVLEITNYANKLF